MTKTGFGFIFVGVFVYFLASQSQIGWLYLFDAIIWSLLVVSGVVSWYSLRSLQVERRVRLPDSARHWQLAGPVEDEAVGVQLRISNRGRLARYFVKVLEDCPFDQPEKRQRAFLLTRLKPKSVTVFSYTANAYRRGYYQSSSVTLHTGSPLGMIVRRRTLPLSLNLTVYPAYYRMEGLPVSEAAWTDWGHAVKSSAAAEFYGSREYQYGDPLRYVHWRNTARRGQLMIKEFERAGQGSVAILLEAGHDFGSGRETTLEYSVKIAASLARLAHDSGHRIDIFAGNTPLLDAGWREAMDYLAYLEVTGQADWADHLPALDGSQIVMAVVPALATGLIPPLRRLTSRVGRLVVVVLENFTPDEIPGHFSARLGGNNVDVISCMPGNLEATVKKLGDSLLFSGISE